MNQYVNDFSKLPLKRKRIKSGRNEETEDQI